jgi:hypothetical protein
MIVLSLIVKYRIRLCECVGIEVLMWHAGGGARHASGRVTTSPTFPGSWALFIKTLIPHSETHTSSNFLRHR